MGPGGDTIRNDSRVFIGPTTSVGNDYISTLEFLHLMEGDEGIYTCNMTILETKQSDHIEIDSIIGEIIMFIYIVHSPAILLNVLNISINTELFYCILRNYTALVTKGF